MIDVTNAGIHNAAKGITYMLGEPLTVSTPTIRLVPLKKIPDLSGGPETEAVGIYLQAKGTVSGQMLIVIPYIEALELVALIMGEPSGSIHELGTIERSALAELGNITGSFFLNTIADTTGSSILPSTPVVLTDMIGSILDVILVMSDGASEYLLMFQATFERSGRGSQASFWIVPDVRTLESLAKRGHSEDGE